MSYHSFIVPSNKQGEFFGKIVKKNFTFVLHGLVDTCHHRVFVSRARTTVSQDVQTQFPVQLAFAKFLSKIKGNF